MIGRLLDGINSAFDIRYRGNGYYQLGGFVISDDVHLLRFISNWMENSNLGSIDGFPVFMEKGGIRTSQRFLLGDYDQITHNFTIRSDDGEYYRVKLIGRFNSIPATVIIYKEGWQTIKCYRPYREAANVPVKGSRTKASQSILFPKMKEISYAEHLRAVKSEFCAMRNMGDPVAKVFAGSIVHFDEDKK